MDKITAIYKQLRGYCALFALALLFAAPVLPADAQSFNRNGGVNSGANAGTTHAPTNKATVAQAAANTDYDHITGVDGLKVMSNTNNFSVTAHGICRYIDVGAAPTGQGILIPFATPSEWIKGTGTTGFLATAASRSFVKLDFCRYATTQGANFAAAGGLSDLASVVGGQQTNKAYAFSLKRVETRYGDAEYQGSLLESRTEDFNMSRKDCLVTPCSNPGVTYPDGSIRNPSFTWNWVETISATFIDNTGKTRLESAAAAKAVPIQANTESWNYSLARTACAGPSGVASDGRGVPSNSCPPVVKAPVLSACAPQNHNQKHWETYSTGNTRDLHDCAAGFIEDPTRRYTYDMQAEYWCFDGTEYPTGATREMNGTTSGVCKPIINGQVGPDNGGSFATLASNDPGLCNSGTVNNFMATASGWTWTCRGLNTGTSANGAASKQSGLTYTCSGASSQLGGAGSVTTSCSRYNSSTNTCEGTNTWTAVNNCCRAGQPNNQSFNVNGFTVSGCNAPAPTNVYAFGDNASGQLGNGTTTSSGNSPSTYVPVNVIGGGNFTSLSANGNGSTGVLADGSIVTFGNGVTEPTRSGTATGIVTAVGAGGQLCTLRTDGQVYCGAMQQTHVTGTWKSISATSGTVSLMPFLAGTGGAAPEAMMVNTCGIRSDNTAWCWMVALDGTVSSFVQLPGSDWLKIQIGDGVIAAIKVNGDLYIGGNNAELVKMPGSFYTAVSIGGGGQVLAIRDANELVSFRVTTAPGSDGRLVTQYADFKVATGTFIAAAMGTANGCALTNEGKVFCFTGGNIDQLVAVPGEKAFSSISAGSGHFLAIEGMPVCLQVTQTRDTTACPDGQNGTITEERKTNEGAVCGKTSTWATVANTCVSNVTYQWDAGEWQAGSCGAPQPPSAGSCASTCNQFVSSPSGPTCAAGGWQAEVIGYQDTNYCSVSLAGDPCCLGS